MNADGEKLSDLRFPDDVGLATESITDIEHQYTLWMRKA